MRRTCACVLAAAAAAAFAAAALAYPLDNVIAHTSASGRHASTLVVTSGGVYRHFSVHVTASPNQRVKGGWALSCGDFTQGGRRAADFAARTPVTRKFTEIPPAWSGLSCRIEGDARLSGRGRITVELLGH